MLTFGTPDSQVLDAVRRVIQHLEQDTGIPTANIMVLGAHARDIIHSGLGYTTPCRSTDDVDLALALSGWADYTPITKLYARAGHSDMRYWVHGVPVDFMPFGPRLEDPPGTVTPPPRKEGWTVAGFQDVFRHAQAVELIPHGGVVWVPSPAGYTALKLRSWADRAANGDTKDAQDLALACHWYTESKTVHDELWETDRGQKLLVNHGFNAELAAAGLLSLEVAAIFSSAELEQLAADLRVANGNPFVRDFTTSPQRFDPAEIPHRQALIAALMSAIV